MILNVTGRWKEFHFLGCWGSHFVLEGLSLESRRVRENLDAEDHQLYCQILRTNHGKGRVNLEGEDLILRKGAEKEVFEHELDQQLYYQILRINHGKGTGP